MKSPLPLLAILLLLASCAAKHIVVPAPAPAPVYHPDTTVIPSFPGEVLYVLGSEYEAIHDSASAKYHTSRAAEVRADSLTLAEYMDQRLVELYPERAYMGYANRVEQLCRQLLLQSAPAPSIISAIQSELPMWDNPVQSPSQTSSSAAAADSVALYLPYFMEFTPREQAAFDSLQRLICSPAFAYRTAFDTLHITSFEEENLLLSLLLWQGPRLFYRVLQSKMRAESLARYYYGERTNSGRQGDAFKHLYVNVLLRSYTSEPIAWLVMDVYWEHAHPNAPCDHFMDAHNNIVGRSTRYRQFVNTAVDSQCVSARQWLLWAEQVQAFVQDSTGNGEFREWDKETPSFIVEPAAQQVSADRYIYWAH